MKFTSTLKLKLIYVFRINDISHLGCLKIGEATSDNEDIWGLEPNSKALNNAAKKRINQYTQTAGISYDLLYTEVAVYAEKGVIKGFSDHEVRNVLSRSGLKKKIFDTVNKANEWFITDLETVKKAITAVKAGKNSLHASEITQTQNPIIFRPEQLDAIQKAKKQFKNSNEMLWFAKMRFGKTLSALQVVKEHNFTRTLILTHRPVVDSGWFEDFGKIFYDNSNYKYGSKNKGDQFLTLEKQCQKSDSKYIYFASMQDLRGSELVGGNFNKNDEIFDASWDFIIVDEAHEGTQTQLGKNVLSELKKENTKVLHLSGTPFNLIDDYKEEEIYTWDYVMEQKAKADWDKIHFGDPNPYVSLPKMNIYTYDLGKLLNDFIDEDVAFNFKEFFRVNESGDFIHKKDVSAFLNLICKGDLESNYPFATEEHRDNFRHSLWMLPGVKEAKAFSMLLKTHPVFSQFDIVNVAGDEEEANEEALKKVENAISDKPHETYTITLSCGRLTTGVSVKAWTAVFMLSGSHNTSASSYMQTIFRVQTPATINGKVKEECFVFDFAPDRTLKVIAETAKVSAKAGKTTGEDRKIMGEFLNFCPIIAADGSRMIEYNVNSMLEQLKKVYIERVVSNGFEDKLLYNNDQLMQLESLDLEEFNGLKKIIGSTKAMPKSGDIDVNKQGLTDEEREKYEAAKKKNKKELTEEDKKLLDERKEKEKNRDSAVSILRGISIRMPLLIYGADIINEEKGLTIHNFADLVDDQSWVEFMPKGVTKATFKKFQKYYEPDVFRAAGKRIRAMARATDKLTIETRIERLTAIFGKFKNPDKETVLTPWRVVNMHLGDCLGGYVFYDDKFENTIAEPRYVNQGKVTENVFSTDTNILEINSKSGLYPLYVAYSIYRNVIANTFSDKKYNELTIEEQQTSWDKVVAKNIFVVCKSTMAKSITKRTLVGFRNTKVNTHHFEDLVNQIINKPSNFIKKIKNGQSYWKTNNINNMKFNAIVGNPPYQENISSNKDNSSLSKQVFPNFIKIGIELKPDYLSLITPSRWFTGDAQDKSFLRLREYFQENNHIESIVNIPISNTVFPDVAISGGINYFLYNPQYNGDVKFTEYYDEQDYTTIKRPLFEEGLDIILSSSFSHNIISKVKNENFTSITEITKGRNAFGILGKDANNVSITSKKKGYYELRCKHEEIRYVNNEYITKNPELADKWKIFISKSNGGAGLLTDNKQVSILGKPYLARPKSACTDSLIPIGDFDTQFEAEALISYIKTKFLRYMVGILKTSQNILQNVYQFVPLQDFTQNSDIDWNKSIKEIDIQLYDKYNLTSEEIEFIESMIKPM